jgi:hypothetical protein
MIGSYYGGTSNVLLLDPGAVLWLLEDSTLKDVISPQIGQ